MWDKKNRILTLMACPAKEIAENCGFVSTNYFYTFFKKKTGVTPQAYREMAVAEDNSLQE